MAEKKAATKKAAPNKEVARKPAPPKDPMDSMSTAELKAGLAAELRTSGNPAVRAEIRKKYAGRF